jgi:LDH2 family malate/lactate/ureidoglycolate dehydrogenase
LSWSFDDASRATDHGAAFLAFDVNVFMPRERFEERVRQTLAEIRGAPKARGVEQIYIPGEMEWERRERALAEGINLPDDVLVSLRPLAEEMGFVLEDLCS